MPSAPDASKQTPALAHLVYNHTAQHSEAKPSKQQQLQPGERAETRSKAAARRIPSILQPPALSSSLRTAATLGMPAATPDQRTALLSGRVLHFCSCSKQSPRDKGASVCQQKKGPICESCRSWEEGWMIRDRLQAQPASMERAARVSEARTLGSGASQHRQSTQWGKGETTSKHVPARREQAPVSFLPTWEKAGCLSKAAFRKGQAGWRGAAPIHGGNKQKQGQPLWL